MSAAARVKRLAREFADCQKDKSGITIEQVGDALDQFVGSFPGPQGTPYEGGRFRVAITAPPRYPFEPLVMKFITKVYHPNISSASGYICLDILKTSWSPVFTLRTCLVSLQSLLSTPEPNDPQDAEVAKHYLTNREGFESTARYWTEVYAAPDPALAPSTTHTPSSSTAPSRSSSAQGPPPPRPRPDLQSQARLAGLDWTDVQTFSDMGFPAELVVETLKFLNYRPGNRENVGEDAVISRLVA
ncbi:hypothetical protein JCM1840_003194 [Sporobolomyces johnsonii]